MRTPRQGSIAANGGFSAAGPHRCVALGPVPPAATAHLELQEAWVTVAPAPLLIKTMCGTRRASVWPTGEPPE